MDHSGRWTLIIRHKCLASPEATVADGADGGYSSLLLPGAESPPLFQLE
jgi:hypothetical protein